MKNRRFVVLLLLALSPIQSVNAAPSRAAPDKHAAVAEVPAAPLTLKLPANAIVKTRTLQNVTSFFDVVGDIVPLRVTEDVVVDGKVAIPMNTPLSAIVDSENKGGSYRSSGQILLRPQPLTLPEGGQLHFLGAMGTDVEVKKDKSSLMAGAMWGGLGGLAGAGLAGALTKGHEVFYPLGTEFTITTAHDITIGTLLPRMPSAACPEGKPVTASKLRTVSFDPAKRNKLPLMSVALTDGGIANLQLACVNNEPVLPPIPAKSVTSNGKTFSFLGWDVLKMLPAVYSKQVQNFTLRFSGTDSTGQAVIADVNFPLSMK